MKRNLILILIVIVAIATGLIYFSKEEVSFSRETSMFKAIPISSPLFVEFDDLTALSGENAFIQEFKNSGISIPFLNWAEQLDTLVKNDKDIPNSLRNESFILSFGFTGKDTPEPLFIKKVESNTKRKAIESVIHHLYPPANYSYDKKSYSGHNITAISSQHQPNIIYFSFTGGLFLASTKSIFVEQAIRQALSQTILDDPYFTKVNKTVTSQSNISLYINHKQFPLLVANWLNNNTLTKIDEFEESHIISAAKHIDHFKKYAKWTELDLNIKYSDISLNGISTADDSLHHFLSVFDGQNAVKFGAANVLPKNTSLFVSYSFSDKKMFFRKLEDYYTYAGSHYKREELIKKMETNFRFNLKEFFTEITNNEIILAATTIPDNVKNKTSFFIIHTEGGTTAEEKLNVILENYAKRKNIEPGTLKNTYSVDKETHYKIYKFPYPSFPQIWLGEPFSFTEANFVSFHDNYMVFSNSMEGLKEYLQNMLIKATLSKDMFYLQFMQNAENKANINTYVNISRAYGLLKNSFRSDFSPFFDKNDVVLKKFHAINWQVISDNNLFFNTIHSTFDQQTEEEAKTTWQSNIGSGINYKPIMVNNHNDPLNREVILQDKSNNLQLITKEGRVRWNIPIYEQILGEIHQIDLLKNGKLQFLFNTRNKLYLLDRNGNNVSGFPVSFRSPATNGISVFDYDNNRNYRYFVACEDKKVYAYDSKGQILIGWDFGHTDHIVSTPVQHFRVSNKDYIVFKDKSRIYIQNRKGETRVPTSVKFENSNNELVLNLNGKPKIVATDNSGKVYYLYFDGKYLEKKTAKYSSDHFFTVDDLNGNGVPDFIFIDGKELNVSDENGKKLFSKKFNNVIAHKPNIYTFASNLKKVGVTDAVDNRIYLFNPNGKLHEGFPLKGNSEFSIGEMVINSKKFNLVVGGEGGDLYNYTLN